MRARAREDKPVANNVRVELIFNSRRVLRWRPMGAADFRSEDRFVEELGDFLGGAAATLIFEIEAADPPAERTAPYVVIRLRYRDAETGEERGMSEIVGDVTPSARLPAEHRLALAAAEFTEMMERGTLALKRPEIQTLAIAARQAADELSESAAAAAIAQQIAEAARSAAATGKGD